MHQVSWLVWLSEYEYAWMSEGIRLNVQWGVTEWCVSLYGVCTCVGTYISSTLTSCICFLFLHWLLCCTVLINHTLHCTDDRHKRPSTETELYVDKMSVSDGEDKYELYMQLSAWRKAYDVAVKLKDASRLIEVSECTVSGWVYSECQYCLNDLPVRCLNVIIIALCIYLCECLMVGWQALSWPSTGKNNSRKHQPDVVEIVGRLIECTVVYLLVCFTMYMVWYAVTTSATQSVSQSAVSHQSSVWTVGTIILYYFNHCNNTVWW